MSQLEKFFDERIDMQLDMTNRQRAICRLVFFGHTNEEISELLNVKLKTVKFHITSIYKN